MLLKMSLLLSLRPGLTLAPAPDVPAKSEKDRSNVVPGEHAIWVCAFNKKKLIITSLLRYTYFDVQSNSVITITVITNSRL